MMRLPLLTIALLASCGARQIPEPDPNAAPPPYPTQLVDTATLQPPAALGSEFAIEQRVTATYPEGEQSFRAMLQFHQGQLLLVGFGPHGGRGFVLTQQGVEVDFESHMPGELPFPPRFMLHDIHRTFFLGSDGPQPDGEQRLERDGEEIIERWSGGRLMERSYRRLDGEPEGVIRVHFDGGMGTDAPPTTIRFENTWVGYTLTLETLAHHTL